MMPSRCGLTFLIAWFTFFAAQSFAQSAVDRWAVGIHGGGNLWVNDMNEKKVGFGGEIFVRYGISNLFSIGLQGGYEELKAYQKPTYVPELPFEYYKLRAMNINLIEWIHLAPGRAFAPYLYLGIGGMVYKRTVGPTGYHPSNKYYGTYHFPVGVGFEAFLNRNTAIVIEASARGMDDLTDNFRFNAIDWYGSVKAGVNFYLGTSRTEDEDTDGLTNLLENKYGTDTKNPDTDGDGLKDGEEVRRYKSDPLKADSDGDGISDGDEVFKYHTDPNHADSDGDGLMDGDEITKYGTDPLRLDTDGDTLTDGDEILRYNSDPLKVDTDGDGLSDWDEARSYKSDPRNKDSDGDGLLDGEEVHKHKTDPIRPDTDGGGVNDGAEVLRGSNPLSPFDDIGGSRSRVLREIILEPGKSVVLIGVNFVTNSAKLLKNSEKVLQRAYLALAANPDLKVQIIGHTDDRGDARFNLKLSRQRAQTVRDWLVRAGVDASRLTIEGKGSGIPIDKNTTPEGRANNRRIEFNVLP